MKSLPPLAGAAHSSAKLLRPGRPGERVLRAIELIQRRANGKSRVNARKPRRNFRTLSDTRDANICAVPAGMEISLNAAYMLALRELSRFSRNENTHQHGFESR